MKDLKTYCLHCNGRFGAGLLTSVCVLSVAVNLAVDDDDVGFGLTLDSIVVHFTTTPLLNSAIQNI